MCEISEIKVISWNGKWGRIKTSDFGVRLKINNSFMANNSIYVLIFKGVEVFNFIIATLVMIEAKCAVSLNLADPCIALPLLKKKGNNWC